MLLAQITDLHMRPPGDLLCGEIATDRFVAAAVTAVGEVDPDAVIVTGDLVDRGLPEEYALLRAELDRLAMPVFVLPGNHDEREAMRGAFADHAYLPREGPLHWIVDAFPLRLIGLDSLLSGQTHGRLEPATLAWLDDALAADRRPTVVAVHHPPFPCGIPAMDSIGMENGRALGDVVARHGHVERVLVGHLHRGLQLRWAGTLGVVAPSVAHQVALDLELREMASWIREPPTFLLHQLTGDGSVITHTAYIEGYGGPRPFRADLAAAEG